MGLVGQDRGELHTRNRGISRWVTIQWPSHKSCGTASTDVVRGAAGIVGTCCTAGGGHDDAGQWREEGFYQLCTSADTWPDTAIGGAEAMSRRPGSSPGPRSP